MADHDHDDRDAISGLKAKTTMGRPQWKEIFTDLSNRHHGSSTTHYINFLASALLASTIQFIANLRLRAEVGVFYCGPSILSKQLCVLSLSLGVKLTTDRYKTCRSFTAKGTTKFVFKKETF